MYLRARNEEESAKVAHEQVLLHIDQLRGSLHSDPNVDGVLTRIELACLLSWQGRFQATQEVLLPLTTPEHPRDIRIEARQLIADNHFRHDQYDVANRLYYENLNEATECGDDYWIARSRDGIAWVLVDVGHYRTGEFDEAYKIFDETLPIYRKHRKAIPEAMGVYGLSRAAAGMGEYDQATELARTAIDLLRNCDGEYLLQLPLLQLANVYRDHGSFDDAIPYYESAIDAADRSQDPYCQALCAYHYGLLLKWTQRYDEAEEIWNGVLPMIGELEFPRLGSEICQTLSILAANKQKYEAAYKLQLESQAYGNRIGIISPVLQNQQMLLRSIMHQTGQLEDKLNYLTDGVEASEDGVFVLGAPSTGLAKYGFLIHFANVAAAHFLGKRPIEIMHVQLETVWKSPFAAKLIQPSLDVYSTGKRVSIDAIELEFTPGNPRIYAVRIAKTKQGVVWTVSDITERETMRQEIVGQRDRLEEANRQLLELNYGKNAVLSIAAHDLRSPIANIRSLCSLIEPKGEESQKALGLIERTSDSLLELITNLLDIEQIESGQFPLAVRRLQAGPIIASLIEQFEAYAGQKEITISAKCEVPQATLDADEISFGRILQNLLSNAFKFSPRGSTVTIHVLSVDGQLRIEIIDQGPGLTDEDKKNLFEKFARLSARPTANESSSGLGLSIVKRLVDAMGGKIGCDSIPGHGATFWVMFPMP